MNSVKGIPFSENVFFKSLDVFRILSQVEYDHFLENMSCTLHKSGSILYKENCILNGVFILIDGVVKQIKLGTSGKEHILRLAKGGDILGFRSNLTGEMACTTAEVLEDAVVCYIPGELLNRFMRINTDFSTFMLHQACSELAETQAFILSITQKKVRERVAEVLIHLKKRFSVDHQNCIKITLSRRELAYMIGTTPESAIRMLCDFRDEKVVDLQGRYIKILNEHKLYQISNSRR